MGDCVQMYSSVYFSFILFGLNRPLLFILVSSSHNVLRFKLKISLERPFEIVRGPIPGGEGGGEVLGGILWLILCTGY